MVQLSNSLDLNAVDFGPNTTFQYCRDFSWVNPGINLPHFING